MPVNTNGLDLDDPALQAAQASSDGIGEQDYNMPATDSILSIPGDFDQTLHIQSLGNLLDGDLFWEMLPETGDSNIG